jgi:hypothetical protein
MKAWPRRREQQGPRHEDLGTVHGPAKKNRVAQKSGGDRTRTGWQNQKRFSTGPRQSGDTALTSSRTKKRRADDALLLPDRTAALAADRETRRKPKHELRSGGQSRALARGPGGTC